MSAAQTTTAPIRVMVLLDAVLDTRLATLYQLNPAALPDILPGYHTRRSDEFHLDTPLISEASYKEAYAKRSVATLMDARPTPIMSTLADIIDTLEMQIAIGHPLITAIEVDVNVWPYQLQQDELNELTNIIAESSGIYTQVTAVSIPYKRLTPDYIRQLNYGAIFIYDLDQWLSESLSGFTARPTGVPNCLVISPALFAKREVLRDPSVFRLPNGKMLDPFDSLTHMTADLYGLRFLDALAFSIVNLAEPA